MADAITTQALISRVEGRWRIGTRDGYVYDIEIYPNYFCATFYNGVEAAIFDHTQLPALLQFITDSSKILIGYNNFKYDDSILREIINNSGNITPSDLFTLSGLLISEWKDLSPEQNNRRNRLIYGRCPWAYSIDLYQVNNGKMSLKEYQCRLGLPVVADSPIPFDKAVQLDDIPLILRYNANDVIATSDLLEASRELVELRYKLTCDYKLGHGVYVMSEAKIADHFMLTRYARRTGTDRTVLKNLASTSPNNSAKSFNVCDLIPNVVSFTTQEFKTASEVLKAGWVERTEKGMLALVTNHPANLFSIGGLNLTFGCGGLHSDDEAGVFHANDTHELWDVDATSFYPSMMIAYDIKPAHMLSVFTEELAIMRTRRLAAKAAGDKLTANALKIVINAIFGKLGDKFSPLRDDKACMKVTLGGQFLLLMLIEEVTVAGAAVLSANTDGLMLQVPKEKAEQVFATLRSWESRTRMTLEEKGYQVYARRDVNNYVAISDPDKHGKIEVKSKGAYNADAAKLSGRIIPYAVQQHLLTGSSLKSIIDNHDRAIDFLFYQRANTDGHFEQRELHLPKTIRWYVTNGEDAVPIERVSTDGKRRRTVPHAHRPRLALELPKNYTLEHLPDLHRQHYIDQAQKLLTNALSSHEVERGTQQARILQDMGLTLIPKRNGKNPAGVALDDIDSIVGLAHTRSECWGVVTGANTQTLTIDLDLPDVLDQKIRDILAQHPTLTTWHGQGTAADVRAGLKRGAVHFQYDGLDARISTRATAAFRTKFGFEVAYGKKVQTVIGQHLENHDDYIQEGMITEAPPELIEYLGLRPGPARKRTQTATDQPDEDALEHLRQAADAVLGSGWATPFQASDGSRGVDGITPGHRTRMRLGLRGRRVWGHSFHVSYDTRGTVKMVQDAFDELNPDPGGPGSDQPDGPDGDAKPTKKETPYLDSSDAPPPQTADEQRTAANCADAFDQITDLGVLLGTTGTGKSWQATKRAIERHDLGEHTLLIAPDKEGIEQMRRYTLDHWAKAGRDQKDLRMQILISTRVSDDDEDETVADGSSTSEIKDTTLIVITHHHFASRKPLTKKLYAVLYWVEEHAAQVILDEGDLYVERQNHDHQLDSRYTLLGGERGQFTRGNHCPSSSGSFRCKGCTKRGGGRVVNKGTHLTYLSPITLMPSQFEKLAPEEFVIGPENLPLEATVDLPGLNLRLSRLAQTPGYLAQRDFSRKLKIRPADDGEKPSVKEEMLGYLRDLIDCSHMPTLADPRAVDDLGMLVEQDPHDLAQCVGADKKPILDGVRTAAWRFPYFVCNSRFLLLYDRAAVVFMMRSASRFIIMSATIGEQQLAFLRDCAEGKPLTVVTIPAPTHTPLDQVILIGHQTRINWMNPLGERAAKALGCDYTNVGLSNRTTIERLGNALWAAGKPPLVFLPTKKDSSDVFERMKERGWNYYIEGEYRMHRGQAAVETSVTDGTMALMSYARSSIGTGANLPQYDVIVVDGTVRRPHYLFNPALKTEDAYLEAQEADRVRIMVQNVGRILRGKGVKYVFVVGATPNQVTKLAKEVARLATTSTATWSSPDDEIRAMAALVASVKAGHLMVPEIPKEAPKSRERQSRKQRAVADANEPGGGNPALEEGFMKALAKVEEMARAGAPWRAVSRAVNAARMLPMLQTLLRHAYDGAYTPSTTKLVGAGAADNVQKKQTSAEQILRQALQEEPPSADEEDEGDEL